MYLYSTEKNAGNNIRSLLVRHVITLIFRNDVRREVQIVLSSANLDLPIHFEYDDRPASI